MSRLKYYQNLIQEKRKKTPFRDFVREIASWNTLNIYKNSWNISRYPETWRVKKLWGNIWEESSTIYEEWDDKKGGFFSHFQKLLNRIPLQYLLDFWNNENCNYADSVFWWAKNAYLSFVTGYNAKNIAYSAYCYTEVHNIYNSFFCSKRNSNIYMSASITESHNIFYSKYIVNSSNIWFSTNLIGCEECILCDGLENKKYCIKNQEYSFETYRSMKAELMRQKKIFQSLYKWISSIPAKNTWSEEITWENIIKSYNTKNSFWINRINNSQNVIIGNGGDSCDLFYDAVDVWLDSDNFYATSAVGYNAHNIYCSSQIGESSNLYYCYFVENCSFCFGCIGLKNKSYCILNMQYTKEEWGLQVSEIFASMEWDGTLGDFFPGWMNPFYFNDTLAYLIDSSFTKEEVEEEGYLWRDKPIRVDIPEWVRIVRNTELDQFQGFRETPFVKGDVMKWQGDLASEQNPQSLRDSSFTKELTWYIDPEVMNIVISDENGNYYRIVKMEYDFLMKHSLPLPTMHWLDRMRSGFCF